MPRCVSLLGEKIAIVVKQENLTVFGFYVTIGLMIHVLCIKKLLINYSTFSSSSCSTVLLLGIVLKVIKISHFQRQLKISLLWYTDQA